MSEPDAFLRSADVQKITGIARSTRYELIARGAFPRPIKLSRRLVAWSRSEISEWMQGRIAARDGGQARSRGRQRKAAVTPPAESRRPTTV
jgi:prophage regulatory protein